MNIFIGKIGQSLNFNKDKFKSNIGGSYDTYNLYVNMFRQFPEHNFYIIGKSNFDRLPSDALEYVNVNNNVFNCYTKELEKEFKDKPNFIPYEYIKRNKIKLDVGLIFNGPSTGINGNNVLKDDGTLCKPLQMFYNYSYPVIYFLNKTKLPYITLVCDPRYASLTSLDLFNLPTYSLSQYSDTYETSHYEEYDIDKLIYRKDLKIVTSNIELIDVGMEESIAIGMEKPNVDELIKNKKHGFICVLNQTQKFDRLSILKDYIKDIPNVEVYGKWPDDVYEDERFKGSLDFDELHNKLKEYRCSFMIPIDKGWVTTKYIELLSEGVIPFMHEYYDGNKVLDLPEYLRVKSPEDLVKKINAVCTDDSLYYSLLTECIENIFTDNLLSGHSLLTIINYYLEDAANEVK